MQGCEGGVEAERKKMLSVGLSWNIRAENQIQSQEPFVGHLPCPRYSVGHTHFHYLLGPYVTQ